MMHLSTTMLPGRSTTSSPVIVVGNNDSTTRLTKEDQVQAGVLSEVNSMAEEINPLQFLSPFEQGSEQFQPWSVSEDSQVPAIETNDSHAEQVRLLQKDGDGYQLEFQVSDLSDHTLVVGPRVGSGSYGRVYLGDHQTHGKVAVKIVHAHDSKTLSSGVTEIYANTVMGKHPNIATLFETRICQCTKSFHEPVSSDALLDSHQPWTESTDSPSGYVIQGRNRMRMKVFSTLDPESSRELQHLLSSLDAKGTVDTDDLYFVLIGEFCNGGTLYDLLRKGVLQHQDVEAKYAYLRAIVLGVAYGMQYMHHMDMVHRDLSNTNIMLHYTRMLDNGRPDAGSLTAKLIDFGGASVNTLGSPQPSSPRTISYSPPEFMMRGESSKSSDIFSLGVLMWEVCTGRCAWEGARDVQVVYAVTSGKTLGIPDNTPCDLVLLMYACMSFDPKERPGIDEVVKQLESMTASKGTDSDQTQPDQ